MSKSFHIHNSSEQPDSKKMKPSVMSKKFLVQETDCIKENVSKKHNSIIDINECSPEMSSCIIGKCDENKKFI